MCTCYAILGNQFYTMILITYTSAGNTTCKSLLTIHTSTRCHAFCKLLGQSRWTMYLKQRLLPQERCCVNYTLNFYFPGQPYHLAVQCTMNAVQVARPFPLADKTTDILSLSDQLRFVGSQNVCGIEYSCIRPIDDLENTT